MRSASACAPLRPLLPKKPTCTQAVFRPSWQNSQVPSEWANGMITRSPRLTVETSAPTSSPTPMASWPIDWPLSDGAMSAYGQRSEPQMQALVTRTMASVGSTMAGSGTSSTRTSPAAYMIVARMTTTVDRRNRAGVGLSTPPSARQAAERRLRRRALVGRGKQERQPGISSELRRLEHQIEQTDHVMVEQVASRGREPHVGLRPDRAKVRAALEHLVDEGGRPLVVRIPSGFGAQDPRCVVGDGVPIVEELLGAVVEKDVAHVVGRAGRTVEDVRIDGAPKRVGGQIVPATVAHQGQTTGERVKRALHARANHPG